jgi:hypothetical protein
MQATEEAATKEIIPLYNVVSVQLQVNPYLTTNNHGIRMNYKYEFANKQCN